MPFQLRMGIRPSAIAEVMPTKINARIVEAVLSGNLEGFLGSWRWRDRAGADRAVIGHDAEDALGLLLEGGSCLLLCRPAGNIGLSGWRSSRLALGAIGGRLDGFRRMVQRVLRLRRHLALSKTRGSREQNHPQYPQHLPEKNMTP